MATGSEILNYTGNANLAFGSTGLPAGSTDAVLDTSPALAAWQQYAQAKYLKGKDDFDKLNEERLKNAAKLAEDINLGNYKFWDKDRDEFMGEWNGFMDMVKKNPTAVYDPTNPEYYIFNDKIGELKQLAAFSSQQKADYDTNTNFARLNGDKIANPNATEEYRNLSIAERAQKPITFDQKIGLNLLAYQKPAKDAVKYLEPTTQSEFDKGNNVIFTTESQVDVEGTKEAFGTMFESAGDDKIAAEEIWRNSPMVQQNYATPKDFFVDALFQISGAAPKFDRDIKGVGFAPAYTQQPKPGSDLDYINEAIRRIQNKDADLLKAFSGTLDGRLIAKAEFVDTTRPVMETDKDGKQVQKLDASGKKVVEKVSDAPTKIKITFTDGKQPLEIVIPQADPEKGLSGGAYNTLYALMRKIEKENNYNMQEVLGDVFNKPEVINENTVPSTSESGIKWQK